MGMRGKLRRLLCALSVLYCTSYLASKSRFLWTENEVALLAQEFLSQMEKALFHCLEGRRGS